jgi:hypothetical protein
MSSTIHSGSAPETPHSSGFAVLPIFVLEDPDLGDHEIRVLLALSSYTGSSGSCWPSLRTLATRCGGCSKRQLARIFNGYTRGEGRVAGLVEKGYVRVELRQSRSNVYRLNFDRWTGRQGGDTSVTDSCLEPPDTRVGEGMAHVPSHIKEVEQDQKNNTPPNPPPAGGRLKRSDIKRLEQFERALEQATAGHECAACRQELVDLEPIVTHDKFGRVQFELPVRRKTEIVRVSGEADLPEAYDADDYRVVAVKELASQYKGDEHTSEKRRELTRRLRGLFVASSVSDSEIVLAVLDVEDTQALLVETGCTRDSHGREVVVKELAEYKEQAEWYHLECWPEEMNADG